MTFVAVLTAFLLLLAFVAALGGAALGEWLLDKPLTEREVAENGRPLSSAVERVR